ncbi:hypothetical protein [Iodobacter fluviatilis]|uniref:Uncharacterized protein n=1 Tax=Iodobacter fluviatilis TaxID=537 RepID=A0A377SUS5_9NEIS|nr:hypothetical protein [Iodobacter fluviatilis]TCU82959.1 hypothetical protein EV682_11319 [Iodobacter fluviatilis]STR45782.1 Uncharacterised protein [Iodobacter fluviatilis]
MNEFQEAKNNIIKQVLGSVEVPPKDFSRDYDMTSGLIGAAVSGSIGAMLGSSIGIAAFGTAISGGWVLVPVFAVFGLLAGKK